MKKISLILISIFFVLFVITPVKTMAEDLIKIVGEVTKIELSADGKQAIVGIKDKKTEKVIEVIVLDEETLSKFKSYKIREGDEVRCKYEVKDGKNISKSLLRTAGC
jgi:hypothetical protein